MARNTHFNAHWLKKPEYSEWLIKGDDNTKAKCKFCFKNIDLSNMGEASIKSHAKGQKHKQKLLDSKTLISAGASSETKTELDKNENVVSKKTNTVSQFLEKEESRKAEILWAIQNVMTNTSLNSNAIMGPLFARMFPDSKICESLSLSPSKLSYLICFGIAPFMQQQLIEEIKKSDWIVVSFDESLNTVLQQGQMDLVVRYFKDSRVTTRYLGSKFLGHAKAEDLVEKFKDGTSGLDRSNLLQISMDGPNVNKKFLRIMNQERESDDLPAMIDVGVCSLHTVSGALRSGLGKSEWKVETTLKNLFYLFDETSAKRDDYKAITGSTLFPLEFCGTRWVENKRVAERAITIWPNVRQYVLETLKKPKSQIPQSTPFTTVRDAVRDKLFEAKLHSFVSLANVMEPYLKAFQSDDPMVPFLSIELSAMLMSLLCFVIKQTVLSDSMKAGQLIKVSVTSEENLLKTKEVDIGFAATASLTALERNKQISQLQIMEFKGEFKKIVSSIVIKLQEKSPLKYPLVHSMSCLDPRLIVQESDRAGELFRKMLMALAEAKWLKHEECDVIARQFQAVLSRLKTQYQDQLLAYQMSDRLDDFWNTYTNKKTTEQLWKTIKLCLTLSHGQAAVERGFSVNKNVLEMNMRETSLISRRTIIDHMTTNGLSALDFDVCKDVLRSCKHAHARYQIYLLGQKEQDRETKEAKKRKTLESELKEAKVRKTQLEHSSTEMIEKADKLSNQGAKKAKWSLVIEANACREKAKEIIRKDLPEAKEEVSRLEKLLNS